MAELLLFGRSAAPGVAKGAVAVLDAARRPRREAAGTQAEEALPLQRALSRALAEVEALAGKATGEAADTLGFKVAMLSDEELVHLRRADGATIRPVGQNRKLALPLRRKSRAAAHAALGDRTSRNLLVAQPSFNFPNKAQRLA
jgi:hypothetical protein